jgi:hypothetical protein
LVLAPAAPSNITLGSIAISLAVGAQSAVTGPVGAGSGRRRKSAGRFIIEQEIPKGNEALGAIFYEVSQICECRTKLDRGHSTLGH